MVGLDAVVDCLVPGIIGAAFDRGPMLDALHDHRVGDHDGDNGCDSLAVLSEHLVKSLGLGDGARESVKKEAGDSGHGLELVLDHAFHNLVRNELAGVDQSLCLEAKLSTLGDLSAEKLAGGDVAEIVFFNHC